MLKMPVICKQLELLETLGNVIEVALLPAALSRCRPNSDCISFYWVRW
jgi:hypothetical protein